MTTRKQVEVERNFPWREELAGNPMAIALHAAEDLDSRAYVTAYLAARIAVEFPELAFSNKWTSPVRYQFDSRFVLGLRVSETMLEIEPVVERFLSLGWHITSSEDDASGRTIEFAPTAKASWGDPRIIVNAAVKADATCVRVRDPAKDLVVRAYRWECDPIPGIEEPA